MAKKMHDVGILFNQFNLTGDHNSCDLLLDRDELDATPFGKTGTVRMTGLKSMQINHAGFFDETVDKIIFDLIDGSSDAIMTIVTGGMTVGNAAYSGRMKETKYTPATGSVGNMYGFAGSAYSNDEYVRGILIYGATAAANGNGTAFNIGAVAAGQSLFGICHITANTAAEPIIKIQSDNLEAFSTPTDIITITGGDNTLSSHWEKDSDANTDAWYRVNISGLTEGESITAYVVIGIH